jgi:hypothetical protein
VGFFEVEADYSHDVTTDVSVETTDVRGRTNRMMRVDRNLSGSNETASGR